MAAWIEACAAAPEALASIGSSADPDTILSEFPAAADRADSGAASQRDEERDDELDAWDLDAHLRHLVRLRQSLAWRQGHLLATFASLRLHRDLGFITFDDWIGERLAMSPRRARYLVSLARRLRDLPLLANAYRRGLESWCQARLLVRVVRPSTQSRWIRYARQVTVALQAVGPARGPGRGRRPESPGSLTIDLFLSPVRVHPDDCAIVPAPVRAYRDACAIVVLAHTTGGG